MLQQQQQQQRWAQREENALSVCLGKDVHSQIHQTCQIKVTQCNLFGQTDLYTDKDSECCDII